MNHLAPSLLFCLAACSSVIIPETTETTGGATTGLAGSSGGPGTTSTTAEPTTTTSSGTGGSSGQEIDAVDYAEPGAAPVGNETFTLPVGDRSLLVELWYPADMSEKTASDKGESILEFVPAGPDRDAFSGLLAAQTEAIKAGVRTQTRSARGAKDAGAASYPLIVMSHCHSCVRFSTFSVAEHLASLGFVVAAPDHVGNTLFDALAGQSAEVGEEFLVVRVGDLSALLDALLGPGAPAVPEWLRGRIDAEAVGAIGHSFGAGTAGRLAQDDPRVKAALPIMAPVENPLFPGTKVAQIEEPLLFVLAEEDGSIQKIGNNLIESNFQAKSPPTYLVGVADAGHWGVTDICGITPEFAAGCGPGKRMSDGTDFVFRDPAQVRAIAAAYAAAFFDLHLRNNPAGLEYLQTATPADVVTVDVRL